LRECKQIRSLKMSVILKNVVFCVLYIYLYDFWIYLFMDDLIVLALIILTVIAVNCAVFFNNNKRRFVSFGICLVIYAIQLGVFSLQRYGIINFILLPGLEKISYEWLGNLSYELALYFNVFISFGLLIISFIIPPIIQYLKLRYSQRLMYSENLNPKRQR
jgi:hypothetical protein